MKFLWLAHAIPYPPKAGFLLRSYNLLRGLARSAPVDLIAFVQRPWVQTLFPSFEEGLEQSRRALGEFCSSVTFLPIDNVERFRGKERTALAALATGKSYTGTWLVDARGRRCIADHLARKDYDLVHFDTIGLAPYLSEVKGPRATLMHHNIESHMMYRRADNTGNALARAYFRHEARAIEKLERETAMQFAAHITCSELDNERLRQLMPELQPIAIPNGVDCDYFQPMGTPPRPASLVFVGTMNWYPNVDAVLFLLKEVWPLLKQRVPHLTLDIAGSNPPDSVVVLGRSLDGVTVHGFVDDVRPLIDSATLFVCPIRDGGGTKLKILDAFAMRKCLVAHPIACEGIDVTPNRDVVFATEPAEYVDTITALLDDEPRRQAIGTEARKLVEQHYSFRSIGEQFAALMERVARS